MTNLYKQVIYRSYIFQKDSTERDWTEFKFKF